MISRKDDCMYINILEILEHTARQYPDKIALKDSVHSVSYKELVEKAKQIASYIIKQGTEQNKPIAVCIDRNIESIILFMGIVYSGNFYVPLDTTQPVERISLILSQLNPQMILSSAGQKIEGYECINYEESFSDIDEGTLQLIRNNVIDTDPLYAIFTSGSTGKPKGVIVSHRSVIDLVEQFQLTFPFPEEPVFGNQAPFDFDVSVKDIYNSMMLGGTVVVIPKQHFSMPLKLVEYLNTEKINTIIWAVSAMRIVENFKTFAKMVPEYLQLVMFSGETMPVRVLNYWREHADAVYVNLYGPTEITCNCTYYIIDREFQLEESLPIGKAFRNTQVFLLNTENGSVISQKDVQGEICVRGTCLALGYYGDEEKTKTSFSQTPFHNFYPERIYHTGDMGYYNEKGELMFASRKDYQIKHMGHRIELGEIEAVINAVPGIDAAVCIFDTRHEKIVLCYQSSEKNIDTAVMKTVIVDKLKSRLPKFMWPNRYEYYENLPVNKNGKIDRVVLRKNYEEA